MFDKNAVEALALLQHAMTETRGQIPVSNNDIIYENPYLVMSRDSFVFKTPGGARFHYALGSELILDCPDSALEAECRLYQHGTVYGSIAWLNAMAPLHASCVVKDGQAVAFTGRSGEGKSTMAAALSGFGWRLVCDDTLVAVIQSDSAFALPDGKPAKLTEELVRKLELERQSPVPFSPNKYYVDFIKKENNPVKLGDLVLLEEGPGFALTPIQGADKIELIGSSLYRGFVHSALHSVPEHAQLMLQLASGLRCWKMVRPKSIGNLHHVTRLADEQLSRLK